MQASYSYYCPSVKPSAPRSPSGRASKKHPPGPFWILLGAATEMSRNGAAFVTSGAGAGQPRSEAGGLFGTTAEVRAPTHVPGVSWRLSPRSL